MPLDKTPGRLMKFDPLQGVFETDTIFVSRGPYQAMPGEATDLLSFTHENCTRIVRSGRRSFLLDGRRDWALVNVEDDHA